MIDVVDGTTLRAPGPVTWAFAAPRLQGRVHAGRLELALWGCGDLGHITLPSVRGPWRVRPNTLTAPGFRVTVARSRPTLLLDRLAPGSVRVVPARRAAPGAGAGAGAPTAARSGRSAGAADDDTVRLALPWGVLWVRARGDRVRVAAGEDADEARAALALPDDAVRAEAERYERGCDALPDAPPLLRSMTAFGLHAATSAVKRDRLGGFAGVAAGPGYATPARSYYRDGYWTAPALLEVAPQEVGALLRLLAEGVQPDGEAPSGVLVSGAAQAAAWERARGQDAARAAEHRRPGDWWSDHFDSPLLFVLLAADYRAATGDDATVAALWPQLTAVHRRYARLDADGDGIPEKPRHDRDWADNVYRSGLVTYDAALYHGALRALATLARGRDDDLARDALRRAERLRRAADARLWLPSAGHYLEYRALDGSVEDHLAIDTLTAVRFGLADEARSRALLAAVRRQLETRHNPAQPYGDWGVMCAWPPYRHRGDLRGKSAFAYRYHNGADWPYWDGVYAEALLRAGEPGWRYPLLRWWEVGLENDWTSPVEYASPPFGRGALLQAWSSLPAAVALRHREAVLAGA